MTPDLLRDLNAWLCLFAFAGLVHRAVSPGDLQRIHLARIVLGLFAMLELIVAAGTFRRSMIGGPFNEAQYVVLAHAILVIALCLFWRRLAAKPHPADRLP